MLNQAISMLSVDDAQVLNLFYKAEQTLEEIGKIMRLDFEYGKSETTPRKTTSKRKDGKTFCP